MPEATNSACSTSASDLKNPPLGGCRPIGNVGIVYGNLNSNLPTQNPESGIRLLIVDDHAVVRDGLEAMLSMAPEIIRIATAADSQETLSACRTFHPDVVLLDLRFLGCDGFQVLKEIRSHWHVIQVLMLSSSASAAEVALARQHGASGYLDKSVDRATLLAAIVKVAAGGSCFRPTGAPLAPGPSPSGLEAPAHPDRGRGNDDTGLAPGGQRGEPQALPEGDLSNFRCLRLGKSRPSGHEA